MSNLSSFLTPVTVNDEREVIISKRFIQRDEKGTPLLDKSGNTIPQPFKVRAISQAENRAILRKCTRWEKDRTGRVERVDREAYQRAIIMAGTVVPDFSEKELCDAYGTLVPEEVPEKMLYTGEYQKLADAIMDLSGIGNDEEIEEEAKN